MDFEKLDVWVKSKDLSVSVYRQFSDLRDWGFKDQITRSSLSVPSNIAEGMARFSDLEKVRFLNIAQGSCAELKTQTYIAEEIGYITAEQAQAWQRESTQIGAMLAGLVKVIKSSSKA